jgi:hypothetical protein
MTELEMGMKLVDWRELMVVRMAEKMVGQLVDSKDQMALGNELGK